MMAELSGLQVEKVKDLFCNETGYQTPKIDTRAAIFKEGKILLVHENNGTWSLPGGWCDVNVSVTENTIKEVKEEAGLDVSVKSVIAIQDREKHNLPVYAYRVCKIFMLCAATVEVLKRISRLQVLTILQRTNFLNLQAKRTMKNRSECVLMHTVQVINGRYFLIE